MVLLMCMFVVFHNKILYLHTLSIHLFQDQILLIHLESKVKKLAHLKSVMRLGRLRIIILYRSVMLAISLHTGKVIKNTILLAKLHHYLK